MFDYANPYTLRKEEACGITHFYVAFTDGQGVFRETEVSRPVYLEFLRFVKVDRSMRHYDERHREFSELTDEALFRRAICTPKSLEETVFDRLRDDLIKTAVEALPEVQRRRFVLYHEFGLTYEQIAGLEGCTKRAVKFSVDLAKKKICKKIENFLEK